MVAAVATAEKPPRPVRMVTAIGRNPRLLETGLDIAAVAFIVLAFATNALSAEFLFHCVFVVLVLHAFLFGLRGTLLRIALASVPLIARADAQVLGMSLPPLELTEWPLMFVIAGLVAWMADMRRETARRYAGLFRQASERLLTVEEDERRRIAGELHDGVGQMLTALTLGLDVAAQERRADLMRPRVRAARRLADQALAETRDLSHRMRPTRIEERGLLAAVRDLVSQSGFRIELAASPQDPAAWRVHPTAMVEVFRIIQEALANAAHHSGAPAAEISLARRGARIVVDVADLGRGFDPAQVRDSGIGLAGMRERARLLGGEITIVAAPGHGTRVHLDVPLDPEH
jgi:signal transduction histidine kinase